MYNPQLRLVYITLVLLLFSQPLWAGDNDGSNGENHCDDLGSICICSEPLDTTSFTTVFTDYDNPGDTTSKQCTHEDIPSNIGFAVYKTSQLTTPAASSLPAGNTVGHVWRLTPAGASTVGTGVGYITIPSGTKRFCVRHYVKFSPDYADNNCGLGKFTDSKWAAASPNFQLLTGTNGLPSNGEAFSCADSSEGINCAMTHDLAPADIIGEWTRVEMCLEHTAGFGSGSSGDVYVEGYWTAITGAKAGHSTTVDYSVLKSSITLGFPDTFRMIARAFRGDDNLTCCEPGHEDATDCLTHRTHPSVTAYREYSHAMLAAWTFQQRGLFIGAASEIEGGGGGAGTGKLLWRRGASLQWPLPYMAMSFYTKLSHQR